jgi:hypothetical protein
MAYTLHAGTEQVMGRKYLCVNYNRVEQRSSGLLVAHRLGSTAVVSSTEGGETLLTGYQLAGLERLALSPDEAALTEALRVNELTELVAGGIATWNSLLSDALPLRVSTAFAEHRAPNEHVRPSGLVIVGGADIPDFPANEVNAFTGFVASPDEMEAIMQVDNYIHSRVAASEPPVPGPYL